MSYCNKTANMQIHTKKSAYLSVMFAVLVTLSIENGQMIDAFQTPSHKRRFHSRPFGSPQSLTQLSAATLADADVLVPVPTESEEKSLRDDADIGNNQSNALGQASVAKPKKNGPSLQTWTRRLNTHEDSFSLHKLSCLAYVLSTTAIIGTGITNGFNDVPEYLHVADFVLLASTVVQQFSSIPMAIEHRRSNPVVRDQFIGGAFATLLVEMNVQLYSPFAHSSFMENHGLMTALYHVLNALILGSSTIALTQSGDLIAARRDKKSKETPTLWSNVKDFAAYVSPFLVNLPVCTVLTWFLLDPSHDRQWFLEMADQHSSVAQYYYVSVLNSMFICYGFLMVTLRDKKLVDKSVESLFSGVIAILFPLSNAMLMPGELPFHF